MGCMPYGHWASVNTDVSLLIGFISSAVTTAVDPHYCRVVFKFKSSKKSNNGTDVNAGQIPQLLYR